ncbi:MAG: glycosyltransferase family 2 protein [Panacagrimonas sp.]
MPASRLIRGHGLFVLVFACWLTATLGAFLSDDLVVWSAGLLYVSYDTWLLGFVGWNTRRLRRQPCASPLTILSLAILVPARNEANVIAACLDAALAQCEAGDEVWVVDDGSIDGTSALLNLRYAVPLALERGVLHSQRHAALRVLRKPHSGKADSLNRAWPLTQAPVVLTLDADTVLHPGALSALRAAFAAEPELAAACGALRPRCSAAPLAWMYEGFQRFEYLRAFLARAAWERIDALLLVSGAFAAYRKDVLIRLGGYDAASLVEDYELIHRLHRHAHVHGLDWRVRVLGNAQATTDAPANLRQFLRQRERWFAGFLETQFANSDMVGNPRYGKLGRLMLPIKAVDTLQPVFGLTAFALLIWLLFHWSAVARVVAIVIASKLALDFCYHLWAIDRYHRWLGERPHPRLWLGSMVASLAEPFSFQLLRHAGAVRGWFAFLTGRVDRSPQRKTETLP